MPDPSMERTSSRLRRSAAAHVERPLNPTARHAGSFTLASARPAGWLDPHAPTNKQAMPTVRRAESIDAEGLAALAERTFRATFGSFNTRENMDAHCAKAYGKAVQASEIVDPEIETFVCDDSGTLIGYAQLLWGAAPPCVQATRPAEIQRIYVEQRWQGKGVAQALVSQVLAAAMRGAADLVWLGVWENNPRAVAFYRKLGFGKVGQHVFQLGDDPQNDWIMCRDVRSVRSAA